MTMNISTPAQTLPGSSDEILKPYTSLGLQTTTDASLALVVRHLLAGSVCDHIWVHMSLMFHRLAPVVPSRVMVCLSATLRGRCDC